MGRLTGVKQITRNPMIIRFALYGCQNRPFFHIVVIPQRRARQGKIIEQIGTYDPLVNGLNEKLVSVNFNRLSYYLAAGAHMTKSVAQLFGKSIFIYLCFNTHTFYF